MKLKKIYLWPSLKAGALCLALILGGFLPFANAASVREIKITAAASSGFQRNPDWQKEIRDRVMFVNQVFEKKFGIHFSVYRFTTWEPQDEKRETDLLIQELRSAFQLTADEIVVGFHKMSQPFEKNVVEDLDTIGTAEFFRGYVILRDPFQDLTVLQRQVTMAHEMAHLFGGIHVAGENQIMNASMGQQPAMILDPENEAIIEITKRVDFIKGIQSLAGSEIDQLIQIYERLIRKNPHSDFYYQLGHFYEVRGLYSRAVAVWEEAVHYQYSNPVIHWELGRYYYQNSRFDAAIQELGSAVAFFILPSQRQARAAAFNFLGVAYYKRGNLELAIFNWLKGLSSDPDNKDLQGNLAAAYLENGDLERGISELLKLSAKYPDDPTTLGNLGAAYLKKKDYQKAAQYLTQAMAKAEYAKEKQVLNEEKTRGKNIQLEPGLEDSKSQLIDDISETGLSLNLGAAYLGLGEVDRALDEFKRVRSLDPKNTEALENQAYAYLRKKEYYGTVEVAKKFLETEKGSADLYSALAEAYAMTGREKEALGAAKSAVLLAQPAQRAALRKNIAVLHARLGSSQDALAELKNSLNDNWNDPDTHVRLGYLYAQMNRAEDAKRSFETALRVDPNFAEAKKALQSMFPKK